MKSGWIEHPKPLPAGMLRGWLARTETMMGTQLFCALYQAPTGQFILAYKRKGERGKVVTERHLTFPLAQARAVELLNSGVLVGIRHSQA